MLTVPHRTASGGGQEGPPRGRKSDPFHEAVPAVVVGIEQGLEPVRAQVVGDARDNLGKRLAFLGIGLLVVMLAVLGYRQANLVLDQAERNSGQVDAVVEALRADLALNRDLLRIIGAQQQTLEQAGLVAPGQVLFPTTETLESLEQEVREQERMLDDLEQDAQESDDARPGEAPRTGPAAPQGAPQPSGAAEAPPAGNQAPEPQQAPPPSPLVDVPLVEIPPVVPGVTGPGGIIG